MTETADPRGDRRFYHHDVLLQTPFWGEMKGSFGWKDRYFLINETGPLLVLTRPLGGGFHLAYVPWGPGTAVEAGDWAALEEMARALRPLIPEKLLFLRFDPPWAVSREEQGSREPRNGFRRASLDIQPPSTVILDITPGEEEILEAMKKKTRYNIRLSEKKGVTVRRGGGEDLSRWYEIYEETALRDRIALHGEAYYRTLFNLAGDGGTGRPDLRLYLAEIEGKVEAGIVVSHQGSRATYLYGASSNNHRNAMPAYALQWRAIREARQAGCTEYDLYGIPPEEDPDHPMAGLYRFKTGFGGSIVHRPGSWDLPFHPAVYRLFRLAEAGRGWYYRSFRKR